MNPGNLTKRVLEHLMDATGDSLYLFAAIIDSGYGASRKKIERRSWELRRHGPSISSKKGFRQQRDNFYSLLYHLQKDGLIERRRGKWSITARGEKKHKTILNRLPLRKYQKKKDTSLKIVIFDIPEKEKKKRNWLRYRLVELDFKMLQKSVWTGRVKLPEEFINDLRDLHLLQYIEIFTVTKSGSLRQLGY